jgi:hypothetical protein
MKKLLLALLISGSCFAQETKFSFTKDGFTDYVVNDVENKTAAELYKKTLDWVSVTFKNPKEVIKAQIENEYIRIEGSKMGLISVVSLIKMSYQSSYQIEISFKEGKYKFDVIEVKYYIEPNKYGTGGWHDWQIKDMSEYFNKKGEIKGTFKFIPESFSTTFNDLNTELKNYLLNSEAIKSKDW